MKSHTEYLTFNLPARMAFENITPKVEQIVKKSGVSEGLVLVHAKRSAERFFSVEKLSLRESSRVRRVYTGKKGRRNSYSNPFLPFDLALANDIVEAYTEPAVRGLLIRHVLGSVAMSRGIRFACASFALLITLAIGSGLASADDSPAQPTPVPRGPGGFSLMRGEELFLLSSKVVQKDLQLTDDQKDSIAKLYEQVREALGAMQGLSQKDKRTKMQELRIEEKLRGILDAKQQARVKEIDLQEMGAFALADKGIAEALKLTDDQVNKIKELSDRFNKEMREAFQSARNSGDASAARDTFTKIRKEGSEKLTAILTDEQKASFEKMKGPKLDLSSTR